MAQPTFAQPTQPVVAPLPVRPARSAWQRLARNVRVVGTTLLLPAVLVTILFSFVPLVYMVIVSLTEKQSFFFEPIYTWANYDKVFDRYLPNVLTTIRLAGLSSLVDLVFGYPFAYILVRKVRYRELVRTMMVFPLFGPLYLSFGLHYLLLPNGPLGGVVEALGIPATRLLYSLPTTLFAMAVFTFPFMVMNVGAALSNVDPRLEEAATCLGAKPWQVFVRVLFPLSWSGILAGLLMCFGWNLGVYVVPELLGTLAEQRVISLSLYYQLAKQSDYGLASAMGVALMILAFGVTWLSLRFSRGALGA
jgi:putative spermidine/putrescine transport system permease protein